MNTTQIEAHVDAVAAMLGLSLSAEHRPGVLGYFGLAAEMAVLVNGLPLSAHDEPAEAFVPISSHE